MAVPSFEMILSKNEQKELESRKNLVKELNSECTKVENEHDALIKDALINKIKAELMKILIYEERMNYINKIKDLPVH